MNAVVAKPDAAQWPEAATDLVQEVPGFWTFRVDGRPCSAARLGTATVGGQTVRLWMVRAPRAVLLSLRAAGFFVRTLRQAALSGAADDVAVRLAWRWWYVDGTLTSLGVPRAVSSYPWTFSGAPGLGPDGDMDVAALVRPRPPVLVAGHPEDYDGEDAEV